MNVIYAEYNIHHNSIDIATTARYLLRIDRREADKGLKATPCSECALNALAIDNPLDLQIGHKKSSKSFSDLLLAPCQFLKNFTNSINANADQKSTFQNPLQ